MVLNGQKGIHPIPVGPAVYGRPVTPTKDKHPDVVYERFTVTDLARKAAVEVERIVTKFEKEI